MVEALARCAKADEEVAVGEFAAADNCEKNENAAVRRKAESHRDMALRFQRSAQSYRVAMRGLEAGEFLLVQASLEATRELSFEERATWGDCPVCGAKRGEWCHAEVGFQFGHRIDGNPMKTGGGAHLGRMKNAPSKVRLVCADDTVRVD